MAKCPRCATENQPGSQFCNRCGLQFTSPPVAKKKHPGWVVISCIAFIVIVCLMCSISPTSRKYETTPQTVVSQPDASLPQTNEEKLTYAKNIIAKPNAESYELSSAYRHLKAIPTDAKEYKEAQQLLKTETERIKKRAQIDEAAAKLKRMQMADTLETKMLSEGYDFYITVEGKNSDIMRVKYVLVSRPMVYKITNETDFTQTCRNAGFKKIIFTDGYDETFTIDL